MPGSTPRATPRGACTTTTHLFHGSYLRAYRTTIPFSRAYYAHWTVGWTPYTVLTVCGPLHTARLHLPRTTTPDAHYYRRSGYRISPVRFRLWHLPFPGRWTSAASQEHLPGPCCGFFHARAVGLDWTGQAVPGPAWAPLLPVADIPTPGPTTIYGAYHVGTTCTARWVDCRSTTGLICINSATHTWRDVLTLHLPDYSLYQPLSLPTDMRVGC